jgi:hypothetical protein
MVQTEIKEFPVCPHFSYCKDIMLKMMLDKPSRTCYREVAEAKGLPCYENDQSGCWKNQNLEVTGERIQVRLPASMRKRMERQVEQPVRTHPEDLKYIA